MKKESNAIVPGVKDMPRTPFVAIVTIHVKPDCVDEFLRILSQVADAVRAELTLISNVAHQDSEDPTQFMLWEIWSDQKDFFEVQMNRKYRIPYETRLPDLLAEPRQVKNLEVTARAYDFCAP